MTFVLLPFILAWRIEEDPSEEELADRKSEEAVTSRCRVFHALVVETSSLDSLSSSFFRFIVSFSVRNSIGRGTSNLFS